MAVEKPKTPGTPPPPPSPAEALRKAGEFQDDLIQPQPRWVRVTIPDYPNVTHLLFHDDGRVTWK